MTSINQGYCEGCLKRLRPGDRVIEVRIITAITPPDNVTTDRLGLAHPWCQR